MPCLANIPFYLHITHRTALKLLFLSLSFSLLIISNLFDMRVAITGASGVLGRAVNAHLLSQSIPTLPLSFTRTSPSPLYPTLPAPTPLDLLDTSAVTTFFTDLQADSTNEGKIDWLIHCAAERRPDKVEEDLEKATKLNRDVVGLLADLGRKLGFGVIYISTDYVFDGKK